MESLVKHQLPGPVFVTGATGFIGTNLMRRLCSLTQDIAAFVLPHEATQLPGAIQAIPGNITDLESVRHALNQAQPTVIIHLAAIGATQPGMSFEQGLNTNVHGTINLLQAAREVGKAHRIVLVGTSYEYGARQSDEGLDPFNAYSASKVASWAFARAAYHTWDAPIVWVRPTIAYGPGQQKKALVPAAIRAALNGDDFRMTKGDQLRDFIYVQDVIEGLLAAAVAPNVEGRSLDLGTGQVRRLRDVIERIWALSGAQGCIIAGALPYRSGEVPLITADTGRTRRLTGWKARTELDEGLRKTIASIQTGWKATKEDYSVE